MVFLAHSNDVCCHGHGLQVLNSPVFTCSILVFSIVCIVVIIVLVVIIIVKYGLLFLLTKVVLWDGHFNLQIAVQVVDRAIESQRALGHMNVCPVTVSQFVDFLQLVVM